MWSFIKSVFGAGQDGSSNVLKVASGIGGWVDNLNYTDQEKSEFNAKMVGHYSDFMKNTVNENSQRSITRRDLSIWIIRFEIFLLATSAVLYKIDADLSLFVYKIATTEPMSYLVLGVSAFFWGTHLVRSLPKKSS